MTELLIQNGIVIDPQSKTRFEADVQTKDGKITAIAPNIQATADALVIDAKGKFVCPGFIDPHGHIDGHIYTGMLSLLQGITTTVGGNCGFSPLDLNAFFEAQRTFPIHQAEMIGMSALREAAGAVDLFQPATSQQEGRMAELCTHALEAGACGVSLGPSYTPGASISEMQMLCRIAATHGKPVSIDTRMNSMTDLDSLQEAIDLAAHASCRMIVSHFVYQYGVGVEEEALSMIDRAREQGVDIVFDSGMYKDWCSAIGSALFTPHIMAANGITLKHLRVITGEHMGQLVDCRLYRHLRQEHPQDAVSVNTGEAQAVFTIAKHPLCMVSTDTGAYQPGEGHPQIAGSFPRFLRKMVREQGLMSWEEAIAHMTSYPAQMLGLSNKGRMQVGCDADLVIFDPDTICDCARFPGLGCPNAAPKGIDAVIVGGQVAARYGMMIRGEAGRAIRIW